MKILIINPSLWIYGGAERVIVKLANYLTDKHHEVSIICYELCDEVRNALKEARIIKCDSLEHLNYFVQEIIPDFDVINIHNEPGYMMTYPRRAKVVWMCNEPPHLQNPEPKDLEKQMVKNFKVIVADQFNKERIDKLYNVDSKIIHYGIDYEFFKKQNTKKFDDFTLIQVGFIADNKNQLRTIEIFKKLKEKIPNAKLKLVGKATSYLNQVRAKIEEYNLKSDIEIIDFSDRENVKVLYHKCHAAIFPVKSQGSWLSPFEAMSAGLPVFISEEATCSSVFVENDVGYVCKTDDDFVKYILEEKENKRAENSKWVKDNLSWDKFSEKMLEVFNAYRISKPNE